MRVADYIAEYLEKLGVEKVFLLSGGGMMHLLDAISRREKITYVCNHHEQSCGMAADAYARVSGKLGVCYATSGPGGTNTLTAVVGAYQDSSPVLFISGQSKVSQTIRGRKMPGLRQFGTFEVDVISTVESVTKYAAFVDDADMIKYHLDKAVHFAFDGRPGSVFLDIPLDIQGRNIDPTKLKGFVPNPSPKIEDSEAFKKDLADLFTKLAAAKKPLFLAGYGVRAAHVTEKFKKLIELLQIPTLTTCFGNDVVEFDHPLFVGHPGVKGDRAGNFAIQNTDLLISVGASLHVTTTGYELDQFAPKAYKVLVDPDEKVHAREEVGVSKKFICNVETFIDQALDYLQKNKIQTSYPQWKEHCQFWKRELLVYKEPHATESDKINFYQFAEKLDQACSDNDIIVTDAGSAFYVVGQAFRTKKNQRVINSGSLGAMGFALPAATGAAFAAPDKTVVCVTGDGSLQTNIHELAVFKRYNLNIKLFVVNNDGYVCIRNTQNNFFQGHLAGTSYESGVFIPDTQKIAQAYELTYMSTKSISELDQLVKKALATPGPVVCEIFTPRYQEIIPTVSSKRLDDGSMKSMPLDNMSPFMNDDVRKKYEVKF